jgi:hypothetical protein
MLTLTESKPAAQAAVLLYSSDRLPTLCDPITKEVLGVNHFALWLR